MADILPPRARPAHGGYPDAPSRDGFHLIPVSLTVCAACLAGAGGECHTPGCAFWMNRAPDIPLVHFDALEV